MASQDDVKGCDVLCTRSLGARHVKSIACAQSARGIEHQFGRAMKVGGRYRKQPKVSSRHAFEARPCCLGLLRVDRAGPLFDAEGAGELWNAPGCGEEFALLACIPFGYCHAVWLVQEQRHEYAGVDIDHVICARPSEATDRPLEGQERSDVGVVSS
jgi:hypothetical protein